MKVSFIKGQIGYCEFCLFFLSIMMTTIRNIMNEALVGKKHKR